MELTCAGGNPPDGMCAAPVFVTKMNLAGTAVGYWAFIGGRFGNGVALNLAGEPVRDGVGARRFGSADDAGQQSPFKARRLAAVTRSSSFLETQRRYWTPMGMESQTRTITVPSLPTPTRRTTTAMRRAMPVTRTTTTTAFSMRRQLPVPCQPRPGGQRRRWRRRRLRPGRRQRRRLDGADNCPLFANPDQADNDGDGARRCLRP